ncbi:hypothetical protein D3C84_201430 [compost metagenome]
MLVQIQPAIRPARPPGGADHQAQHAVAPAAGPLLVGLGEQVVDLVDPLGVERAQWLAGEIAAGVEVGVRVDAGLLAGRCPAAEMLAQVTRQRGAATGVAGVEEEVLHVHRDELARVAQFVDIRAARHLAVGRLARAAPADLLRPAGQVEQARIVAEGETARRLAAAGIGQADRAEAGQALPATLQQALLILWPELRAVVEVSQLVQHGGQQLTAHVTVRTSGRRGGGASIAEGRQQLAVQFDAAEASGATVDLGRHGSPAHLDAPVQALLESGRKGAERFGQESLAGLPFAAAERSAIQRQMQLGIAAATGQQGKCQQPGAGQVHLARMASAST